MTGKYQSMTLVITSTIEGNFKKKNEMQKMKKNTMKIFKIICKYW